MYGGPRRSPATKTNRLVFDIFDPQQARDRTLPSARSASTFGHHSTFAQPVRFLPCSHLSATFCHLAGNPPLRIPTVVRSKRPPPPAPCELCDRSSFIDGATISSLAKLSLLPRGGRLSTCLCCFLPQTMMAPVTPVARGSAVRLSVIRPPRLTIQDSSVPRHHVAETFRSQTFARVHFLPSHHKVNKVYWHNTVCDQHRKPYAFPSRPPRQKSSVILS